MVNIADRLWSRVVVTDSGCWEWQGARCNTGYGKVMVNGRVVTTHRVAWSLINGNIPAGLYVLHRCDNRICINPDHLFIGSHAENMQDKITKGRHKYKLSDEQVRDIRVRYCAKHEQSGRAWRSNADELADEFGVHRGYVMNLVGNHKRAGD